MAPEQFLDEDPGFGAELVPIQFVESQRSALSKSAGQWTKVYQTFNDLNSESMQVLIKAGVDHYAEAMEMNVTENQLRGTAERMVEGFSLLSLLAARAGAANIVRSSMNVNAVLFDGLPQDAFHFATRKDGPATTYAVAVTDMMRHMKEADSQSQTVLKSFAGQFGNSPGSIAYLADLYDEGADKVDPAFHELKEVIRTDWYAKDPQTSVLRTFITGMRENSDLCLSEFVDEVIGSEDDRRLAHVRNMARFALGSATTESPEALRDVLLERRSLWGSYEEIDGLFAEFKRQRIAAAELALNKIAGPAAADNPRLAGSFDELAVFKRLLHFNLFASRDERRTSRKRTGRPSRPVARPEVIVSSLADERYNRADQPIFFAKNTNNSTYTKEIVDDDTPLKTFVANKVPKEVVDEITASITKLHENPLGAASRVIKSGAGLVTIDGKKVKLRRFRPDHEQGLTISQEAMGWRICYTLIDGSIVVTDILTHDQFDRKYT